MEVIRLTGVLPFLGCRKLDECWNGWVGCVGWTRWGLDEATICKKRWRLLKIIWCQVPWWRSDGFGGPEKLPLLSNALKQPCGRLAWNRRKRRWRRQQRRRNAVRFLEGEVTPGRSFSVDPTWSCQQCKNESTRFKAQSRIIVTLSSHIIHTYVIKPLSASSLILSD